MSTRFAGSITRIEQAVMRAEQQKSGGDYAGSLQTLAGAIFERFFGDREARFEPLVVDVLAIEKLADLAALFGEVEAADDLLHSLQEWYAQGGNLYFSFYVTIKRIHLMLGSAKLDEAYETLKYLIPEVEQINLTTQGLEAWEDERFGPGGHNPAQIKEKWPAIPDDDDRALLLASLYLEMGRILLSFGQYAGSLSILERGLLVAAKGSPALTEPIILQLRIAIATSLLEKGDLPAARAALHELPELSERFYPGLVARREELLGKIGLMTGDFGESLNKSLRVLKLCTDYRFHRAASVAGLNLAHVMIYLNQTGKARGILSDIKDRALERHDVSTAARADYLLSIADARGRSLAEGVPITPSITELWCGAYKRREGEQSQAISAPLLPVTDDYLSFFEDRSLAFHWHLGSLDFPAASRYLDEIAEVFVQSDSELIKTRLQLMRGMLYYYEGRFGEAEAIFDYNRKVLANLGLLPELWQAQRFLGWCRERLGRDEDELLRLAEETNAILDRITKSLPPEDQVVFLLNKWTADEEYIAREINKVDEMKRAAARSCWLLRPVYRLRVLKRLCALLAHIDSYKDRVVHEAVEAGQDNSYKRSAWSLVRRLLSHSRDRHTIAFLVLPDRVLVVSLGRRTLDFGVSPLTRLQLRENVAEWHSLRSYGGKRLDLSTGPDTPHDSPVERQREIAARLAESLQLPIILDGLSERVSALTIVPDDSLHGFPFAALIHNGQYLIKRFAISIGLTISGRGFSRKQREGEALVVGVSRGAKSDEYKGITPLPGTVTEIHRVQQWLAGRGANIVRVDDFGESSEGVKKATLLEQLPKAALAHIACHGIFKPDRPDQSGLIIVHNSKVEILSLRDLAKLDLSRMRHITLSACWLADSFVLPGRWVISLPEVLWRAGAGSILASLWPVSDRAAGEIMELFYQYLIDMPRDKALQRVINECAQGVLDKSAECQLAAPFYWAGYYIYGDDAGTDALAIAEVLGLQNRRR